MNISITKFLGKDASRITKTLFWWSVMVVIGIILAAIYALAGDLSVYFYTPWNHNGRVETRNPMWIIFLPFGMMLIRFIFLKYASKTRRIAILESHIAQGGKGKINPEIVEDTYDPKFEYNIEPEDPKDREMSLKEAERFRQAAMTAQMQNFQQIMMMKMMSEMGHDAGNAGNAGKRNKKVGYSQGHENDILNELRKLNDSINNLNK